MTCYYWIWQRLLTESTIKSLQIQLQAIGMNEDAVDWVMQFLTNRKLTVKIFHVDGRAFLSEVAAVGSGMPQGTVLSPTLFNMYINDVPEILSNKVSLYADDWKLMSHTDTMENIKSTQPKSPPWEEKLTLSIIWTVRMGPAKLFPVAPRREILVSW